MAEPIVFISHFAVKDGRLEDLKRLASEIQTGLFSDKPATVAYLMYLDEDGSRFTVAHCFPDAGAMDRHFEGSDERTAAAFEVMEPQGWEVYGRPSDDAVATLRQGAEMTGVPLTLMPDYIGGFLRMRPSQ
jgi:hypothetical protein